uniref:Aa_trans domain-containing protein n=1 Tax=Steinernema glaseri TaxID=37863 RepID=A0A1I7YD13_9BILA
MDQETVVIRGMRSVPMKQQTETQSQSPIEESTTCHGLLPIKKTATAIAVINIIMGACGIPVLTYLSFSLYSCASFIAMVIAGIFLLVGIYRERPYILSYFRTYQWLVNLCCVLTVFALFFLQFNITTFIDKYWPELHKERPIKERYTAEEYNRGHIVLTLYTVALIAYIFFGIVSMYVLKKCMRYFQYIHKDTTNYITYMM